MKLRREIQKCQPHGRGMIVRVRFVALDDQGAEYKTSDQFVIHHEIEEVVTAPWKDDTHESYVAKVAQERGWQARAEAALEKTLLHNGLLKPAFTDVPELNGPKVF